LHLEQFALPILRYHQLSPYPSSLREGAFFSSAPGQVGIEKKSEENFQGSEGSLANGGIETTNPPEAD
jgi:hypothetical protein